MTTKNMMRNGLLFIVGATVSPLLFAAMVAMNLLAQLARLLTQLFTLATEGSKELLLTTMDWQDA